MNWYLRIPKKLSFYPLKKVHKLKEKCDVR